MWQVTAFDRFMFSHTAGLTSTIFIAGVAGIAYGIKKKNKLTVVVAVAVSIIFGLMILAGILLISGID